MEKPLFIQECNLNSLLTQDNASNEAQTKYSQNLILETQLETKPLINKERQFVIDYI